MNRLIKETGLRVLNSGPVYQFLRQRALRKNPVTVLCYHTLRSNDEELDAWIALRIRDFQEQVKILRAGYDIVSLDDALKPSQGGRPKAVLTFDDGEIGLFTHLLPFVEQEQVPVTVYVATGQIETGQPYWFDRVMNALQGDGVTSITLEALNLSDYTIGPHRGKSRWQEISGVLEVLKQAPTEQRDALADQVVAQASNAAKGITPLAPMSVEQLKTLADNPYVTIGAHTHDHSLLDQIPLDQASTSIAKSRDLLEKWTGKAVRHFAYPNGNHNPALHAEIERLGFASATILNDTLSPQDANRFALPRMGIGRYDEAMRFRLRLVNV